MDSANTDTPLDPGLQLVVALTGTTVPCQSVFEKRIY